MIACRPPTPGELDTMLAVMCEAFGLPFSPARDLFYRDPAFNVENKRVLAIDGKIVSCLTIVDAVMQIGEASVRLAGIANVCTSPGERCRGYAAHLLIDTIATLRERGFGLSALLPFSYRYYRRLGWELGSTQHKLTVSPAQLPAYTDVRHVRAALPSDLPGMERLYAATSARRTGFCLRDSRRWAYLFEHAKSAAVYKRRALEGYAIYEVDPLPDDHSVLRLLEVVTDSVDAARGIVSFLAGHAGSVTRIEYTGGAEDVSASGIVQAAADAPLEEAPEIRVVPGAMFRIIDFGRVLGELSPNFAGFRGKIALALDDPYAERTPAAVAIEGDGTTVSVTPIHHDGTRARIRGDVRPWSQVVIGFRSLSDALSLNRLTAFSESASALGGKLFPRRDPFIPVPDHF